MGAANESEEKTQNEPLLTFSGKVERVFIYHKHDIDDQHKESPLRTHHIPIWDDIETTLLSTKPLTLNDAPFPIYNLLKHDDDDPKEPTLKPHEYEYLKIIPKGDVPDLKLFENMEVVDDSEREWEDDDEIESDDKEMKLSPPMKRMVAVLNYYNSLMIQAEDGMEPILRSRFIEFCDRHYGQKWMMEDYIHFIANYSDTVSMNKLAAFLKWKCHGDLKRCGITKRHYRDRQRDDGEDVHFYIDTMDSLHFNVLHLVDVGLRVNHEKSDSAQHAVQNNQSLVDESMVKMLREIHEKRQQTAFDRIDANSQNSKFTLCSSVHSNLETQKGGSNVTTMDRIYDDLKKNDPPHATMQKFVHFVEDQRYDTETMNDDMVIHTECKDSNLLRTMDDDPKAFGALRRALRYHRVSGTSFSTGIWWAYWPWYREQTLESVMSDGLNEAGWSGTNYKRYYRNIDFGGHSMKSLCVYPRYNNLKEEVMSSGLITTRFWTTKLVDKVHRYFDTSRCRKMVFNEDGMWAMYDEGSFHFGTGKNFKVSLEHLQALILYTDSSEFCTAFSETFRAMKPGETIEEMNQRNSKFYWVSRYLRELIYCFGEAAYREATPYYTGLSYELYIPQFQIGLYGPTSTTIVREVAVRFAGENGMLIRLKGGRSHCFDASWISAYPEEQERIFFGSTRRETVTSIVLVNSCKNYKAVLTAFTKFDAIFSGQMSGEMSNFDVDIIKESLRWIDGGEDSVNHNKLDLFILETFYSFIIHKKTVVLDLLKLSEIKNNVFVDLVLHPMWKMVGGTPNTRDLEYVQDELGLEKPENANLLKSFVFTLFLNVHQIKIVAGEESSVFEWQYPFDLISFLRLLQSVDLPQSLEVIMIQGCGHHRTLGGGWMREDFTAKVEERYNLNGIKTYWEGDDLVLNLLDFCKEKTQTLEPMIVHTKEDIMSNADRYMGRYMSRYMNSADSEMSSTEEEDLHGAVGREVN